MTFVVSAEDVELAPPEGNEYPYPPYLKWGEYIGHVMRLDRGPQAFVIDYAEPHVIKPHFHQVDQFQIVVRGEGHIGKEPFEPVTVHYTDSYTPYGPIKSGEGGLRFFNLRPRADIESIYMPGNKDRLARRGKRHRTATFGFADSAAASGLQRSEVIPPEHDGLLAYNTVAGPGVSLPDDVARGSGAYELVLTGSIFVNGRELIKDSVLFAAAGESMPERRAGEGGAQVLTVQAPTD